MEMIDNQKTERVWSRVMSCQNAAAETSCTAAEDNGLSPRKLFTLAEEELRAAACYCRLAGMLSGCAKKSLLRMAADERCHAKKFAALYFLATGKKACLPKPQPCCVTCVSESLRQLYCEELAGQKQYEQLADHANERGCTLRQMAADEGRHASCIYEILQGIL